MSDWVLTASRPAWASELLMGVPEPGAPLYSVIPQSPPWVVLEGLPQSLLLPLLPSLTDGKFRVSSLQILTWKE